MNKVLLTTILIAILAFNHTLFAEISSKELYEDLKASYDDNFPDDFVASVSGNEIKRSLRKIPKESYCKRKKPKVIYLFLKGEEESIIVENVENPYVTRFQAHIEIYKSAKAFIDSDKSFAQMKRTYFWKVLPSNKKGYYLVKMRKHRIQEADYYHLYINRQDLTLRKILQFSNRKQVGRIDISFRKVGKYLLPSRLTFDILKKGRKKRFALNIINYKVNVGLTSDLIISLQDDCPSLKLKK